jgi:RNA polymerase sigma-70 factor (ECF subfamily)
MPEPPAPSPGPGLTSVAPGLAGTSSAATSATLADVSPDAALVARCRRGEPDAWRALYDAHWAFVYRTARRLGTPQEELEDVVHDVFVVVLRKLDTFEDGRLTTWLYRITANTVSDRHRRRRVRSAFAALKVWIGAAPPPAPDRRAEQACAERRTEQVLARMSPKKREVLALHALEGLSGDEIAERLGCPVNTVWTRLHHARREFAEVAEALGCLERED